MNKQYDSNNIFAKILRGEIEAKKYHETNHTLCIYDIAPLADFHILCLPKIQSINILDFKKKTTQNIQILQDMFTTILKIVMDIDAQENILILSNVGAGPFFTQHIFHTHIHIIAPWKVIRNRNIVMTFKKLDKNALNACLEKLPDIKQAFNFQILKNNQQWEYSIDIEQKNL